MSRPDSIQGRNLMGMATGIFATQSGQYFAMESVTIRKEAKAMEKAAFHPPKISLFL